MAKKDYYKTLGLDNKATQEQIKSSYNKLTLKYHPDRHANKGEAEKQKYSKMFQEVREAYEILSDPKKRESYDRFGTVNGENAGFEGFNFQGFDLGGFTKGFKFTQGFDEGVFDQFSRFTQRDFNMEGFGRGKPKPKERPAVEFTLQCTLDELYSGCNKKLKLKRTLLGRGVTENIIEIKVKPGYKKGTKFTFPEQGDQIDEETFQDIRIILDEKPDRHFVRNGNDLEAEMEIHLKELIKGFSRVINLPGGRTHTLSNKDVSKIGEWICIPRKGMPFSKDPERKGDLKIRVISPLPLLSFSQIENISKNL
jgi:DnaJ-class molecular chaperone